MYDVALFRYTNFFGRQYKIKVKRSFEILVLKDLIT